MQPGDPETLLIEALGHRGDGIARTDAGVVHVPYTLPGERVTVRRAPGAMRSLPLEIAAPSPSRAAPECDLFGRCGGCALQHMERAAYLDWKRGLLDEALRQEGIGTEAAPCLDVHGAGRRRMTLHARTGGGGQVIIGFTEARSHAVVPVARCPIVTPALNAAFPAAEAVAGALRERRKPLDIAVTDTPGGIDMDVRGHEPVDNRLRLALSELAAAHDLARLSVHGDVILERRPPRVRFGAADVVPPPGGFLQATIDGEAALARLVLDAVADARRIADLFAGCGTFALRLAARATVHAVEGDRPALAALERAARHTPGLKPVRTETRDLFRRPLTAQELKPFDAVVFDPPRAGAEAQARQIARAQVPVVVAVSCAPATLARDLRILLDGGYKLREVTPVDQFRYSAHVESVAVLTR